MDIKTEVSLKLVGTGLDLLPELKNLYQTNGGCFKRVISVNGSLSMSEIHLVDQSEANSKPTVLQRSVQIAYIAVVKSIQQDDELNYIRAGFHGVLAIGCPLVAQLSAIDRVAKGEMLYSIRTLSSYIIEIKEFGGGFVTRKPSLDVTIKEQKVVDCIFKGMSNTQIAESLNISPNTVKMHLQNIYRKNKLKGRVHLISSY
ncbi:LuxR C-terminal-related transcriptional regulator [Shewanella amazonensis]|uniref:Response regulator receiver protein n=1 Tax=Shewanella amazonensis (strain ATCC BAA-1098 / SB2B) TaxID=326297 RepID=A1S3F1_SHEAM|nr:LuxR C-terminal-related transcriptional regulator [Shewanella amazonensis]ABL98907.1 response regulator receiver protein [Shewanella amazonensis SB2B]